MIPLSLITQISKKIIDTFTDIGQMCKAYEQSQKPVNTKPSIEIVQKHNHNQKEKKIFKIKMEQSQIDDSLYSNNDNPFEISFEKSTQKTKIVSCKNQKPIMSNQKRKKDKKQKYVSVKSSLFQNAPKVPVNSYLMFFRQRQPEIMKQYQDISLSKATQIIAKQWNNFTQQQKDVYLIRYVAARKKYQQQLELYKEAHPQYSVPNKRKKKAQQNKHKKNYFVVSDEEEGEQKNQCINIDEDSMGPV